jgi:CD2 antigen cytoplasmic tail-binding protein 2
MQRMLPAPSAPPAGASGSAPRPPPDNRQFQYRFSMTYIRSLPEGQRPVERELFGLSF